MRASHPAAWTWVVTAFALTACGGGGEEKTIAAAPAPPAAPAPAPAAGPAPSPSPSPSPSPAPTPAPSPSPSPSPSPAPAPGPAPLLSAAEQLLPTWARNYVATTELYVSPSGNDSNTGATRATALKTTAAAIARLAPGVRLNFTAGTYGCAGGFISNINGGTTAPGTIRSVDGPRAAKFDCASGGSFLLDFVHGFIFEGIEVSNTAGHGIQVMSGGGPSWDIDAVSSDIVVHNAYIHHTGLAGMKSSQARRITAIGNELAYIPIARQTLEFVAVDEVTIAGNEAHHSGYFDEIKGGAHGPHVIFANYIHDSDGGILVAGPGTGYQYLIHTDADFEARDLKVWNNVVVNVPREAFYIWACHDCVVAHNSYYGAAPNSSFRILPSDFTNASGTVVRSNHNRNVTIVTNLFLSGSRFNDMIPSTGSSETSGLVMSHNLWYATGLTTTAGIYSDLPFAGEPTSFYANDPKLAVVPLNMRPLAGSPVIGKGLALPFAATNFDGIAWGAAPNIGAY
jgi:hypothetical protein